MTWGHDMHVGLCQEHVAASGRHDSVGRKAANIPVSHAPANCTDAVFNCCSGQSAATAGNDAGCSATLYKGAPAAAVEGGVTGLTGRYAVTNVKLTIGRSR